MRMRPVIIIDNGTQFFFLPSAETARLGLKIASSFEIPRSLGKNN